MLSRLPWQSIDPGQKNAGNTVVNPALIRPEPGKVTINGQSVKCNVAELSTGVLTACQFMNKTAEPNQHTDSSNHME